MHQLCSCPKGASKEHIARHSNAVRHCREAERTCSRWYCSSDVSFVQLVARIGLLRMLGRMLSILLPCLACSTVCSTAAPLLGSCLPVWGSYGTFYDLVNVYRSHGTAGLAKRTLLLPLFKRLWALQATVGSQNGLQWLLCKCSIPN
jgi:hypothetical protein